MCPNIVLILTGWPLPWKSGESQENEKGLKWSGKSQGILTVCSDIEVHQSSVST